MGYDLGNEVDRSLAVTAALALASAFALGWIVGRHLPQFWDVLMLLIHAATSA